MIANPSFTSVYSRKVWLLILAVSWSLLAGAPTQGQSYGKDVLHASIDSVMEAFHDSAMFNGTVLVAHSGIPVYRKAWGEAYMGMPLSEDTPFYLGSIAKQFTAMVVMILLEENDISLDQTIDPYFQDLPSFTREITIRNLLNHTSGLPDYYSMGKHLPGMTNKMVWEVVHSLDSLDFIPGSQYAYSNTGYVLLSLLVERISGGSLKEILASLIFKPLGMKHSMAYDGSSGAMPPHAVGHTAEGLVDDYQAFTTGAGGIFSQIDDLFTWDQALYENQMIDFKLLKEAYSPATLSDGKQSYYGFGWRLQEGQPHIVQHSGSLAGFKTYMYRDLDKRHTIILLSNFTNDVKSIKEVLVSLLQ